MDKPKLSMRSISVRARFYLVSPRSGSPKATPVPVVIDQKV
jgi:hypothetical protein